MTQRLSRRRFMTVATASVGAVALGEVPVGHSATGSGPFRTALEDGTPIVSGIVGKVESGALVLEGDAPSVEVQVRNADVWRDGKKTASALRSGDYVVAKGSWLSEDTFAATEVSPTYFNLAGSVRGSHGDVLSTTGGEVRVTEATRLLTSSGELVATKVSDIEPGAQVAIMARRETGNPGYVAVHLQLV